MFQFGPFQEDIGDLKLIRRKRPFHSLYSWLTTEQKRKATKTPTAAKDPPPPDHGHQRQQALINAIRQLQWRRAALLRKKYTML